MNTHPDETTLALWLDDELFGSARSSVDAWAMHQPEQLAAREAIRHWRATVTKAIPATEEPPYPDFFNSRLLHEIRKIDSKTDLPIQTPPSRLFPWKSWWMPVTACAGMALSFWIGQYTEASKPTEFAVIPRAIIVEEPVIYTPENGVNAEWFASHKASATVIVLSGVKAIPDSTDFSATVHRAVTSEIQSTAHQPTSATDPSSPR